MNAPRGKFVWYDLMTSDVEAAKAFYTETIGWKIQMYEADPDKPYPMLCVGEQPIGGMMVLPEEAKKMGAPPHWMAYVATDDVDATAKKCEALGGKVLNRFDIPDVGRVAILADPQGAVISAFTPANEMKQHEGDARPGDIGWHELNTTDWEAAFRFYSELFGWKESDTFDMGPEMGTYYMFNRDGAEGSTGGMCNGAKGQDFPPGWLYYITVDGMDAALERIKSKGGKITMDPMEVPGGDQVAHCMDPQGVMFAIVSKT